MSKNHNPHFQSSSESEQALLEEFGDLWAEAEEIWDKHQDSPAFHGYVSADYLAVYQSLARLQGSVLTVLEWGSGLGVVTIMASRMGFEAYGIEAEGTLVEYAEDFAQAYGPEARFAEGSFIPEDYEWKPEDGEELARTILDAAPGYDDLDMELRDFDLIYAYPWPGENALYHNIIRDCGRRESLFLSFSARDGVELIRFHKD